VSTFVIHQRTGVLDSYINAFSLSNVLTVLLLIYAVELNAFQLEPKDTGPELLNMSELKALAGPTPPPETLTKLEALLNTPFISNRSDAASTRAAPSESGLWAAFWNIERGLQLELIRTAFTDPAKFRRMAAAAQPMSNRRWNKAELELAHLRRSDITILNEVDFGMKRTKYANVASEFADIAGMNATGSR
jgi:hypothetical protein